jgi:YceI-like domain
MKPLFILSIFFISLMTISCKSKTAEDSPSVTTGSVPPGVAFQVDVPRSELKWNAFKPTGEHHGIVPISGGTIYMDGDLITGGNVEFNMAGLEAHDMDAEMKEKLESHLKGTVPGKEDDFFNVGKFPTATYTIISSSKLENDPLGTHMINGELRIRDITKPVSIKAKLDTGSGNAIKATTEPFVIDRTEWDIKFKSKKFFDDLKDDFINDEIKLEITLGAVKS